jgi:hypothetical protein
VCILSEHRKAQPKIVPIYGQGGVGLPVVSLWIADYYELEV